ncbi:MAG: hypothetical protein ACRYHA_02610 [Janthinobacterium lividum]
MQRKKGIFLSLLATAIFLIWTAFSVNAYVKNSLDGKVSNTILSSQFFGVPEKLAGNGLRPAYADPNVSGWDGQFYFYMTSDILGRADAAKHIDSPSYRYQRIGPAILVKLAATALQRTWITPGFYLAIYFLLVACGTYCGGLILARFNANPLWVLLWTLYVGTQVTLVNALPDAAADAFLLIAIWLWLVRRAFFSTLAFALSALSREAYIVYPVALMVAYLWNPAVLSSGGVSFRSLIRFSFQNWRDAAVLSIAPLIAIGWRIYVTRHFGASPSSQAFRVLAPPFSLIFSHGWESVSAVFSDGRARRKGLEEIVCIFLFSVTLLLMCFFCFRTIIYKWERNRLFPGVALASLMLSALYFCLGPTVFSDYIFYLKTISLFGVVIILLMADIPQQRQRLVKCFLICATAIPFGFDCYERVFHKPSVTLATANACYENYGALGSGRGDSFSYPRTNMSEAGAANDEAGTWSYKDTVSENSLGGGWSGAEPWGRWSEGAVAQINLPGAPGSTPSTVRIDYRLSPEILALHREIRIKVNGKFAKSILPNAGTGFIFVSGVSQASGLLSIEFENGELQPVKNIIGGDDTRALGVGIVRATLVKPYCDGMRTAVPGFPMAFFD